MTDPLTPKRPLGLDTLAIREGIARTQYNEHNEPMFLTSSYCAF